MRVRVYRGYTIDRSPTGGLFRTFLLNVGWVRADTLAGICAMIDSHLDDLTQD